MEIAKKIIKDFDMFPSAPYRDLWILQLPWKTAGTDWGQWPKPL